MSEELAERPKATVVGDLFATLSYAYPYEKQMKQLLLDSHPPREAQVTKILNEKKVPENKPYSEQNGAIVTNMWEGMERFMKSVDFIGRSNVELKQFQHLAEAQFSDHNDRIEASVPRAEHEA